MQSTLKEFLSDLNNNYSNLRVNDFDIIKLANKSRYTNDIVRKAMKNNIIPFPRFDSFNMKSIKDWDKNIEKYGKSYQLYIHTLRFVNELLLQYADTKQIKYLDKAEEYIESWIEYATKAKVSRMVWYDHSAAQRTQVLLYFVYLSQNRKQFNREKYGRLLEYHGIFLAENAIYHKTNHGLMMDRSIMTLGIVLSNDHLFNYGYFRSIDTFWHSFSSRGLHLENSPGYHNMVVKMYNQIEYFLNKNNRSYGKDILSTLEKAEDLKGLMSQPNGILPNIGDTGNNIEQVKNRYDNFVDYEGGLSIIQNELLQLYSTFICGYSSVTHKHHDDLSFTLMYKGIKFLEEAGRYNYTRHAYRKYIKSERAHSGIYLKDESYELNNDNRYTNKVRTDFHLENENLFQVKGTHDDYKNAKLSRQVIYIKTENIFILFDQVNTREKVEVVHNFNLNKNVDVVNIHNQNYLLENEGVELLLKCHSKIDNEEILRGSTDLGNIFSINSPNFNEVEKTSQIKFYEKLNKDETSSAIFSISEQKITEKLNIKYDLDRELLEVCVDDRIYYFNV